MFCFHGTTLFYNQLRVDEIIDVTIAITYRRIASIRYAIALNYGIWQFSRVASRHHSYFITIMPQRINL